MIGDKDPSKISEAWVYRESDNEQVAHFVGDWTTASLETGWLQDGETIVMTMNSDFDASESYKLVVSLGDYSNADACCSADVRFHFAIENDGVEVYNEPIPDNVRRATKNNDVVTTRPTDYNGIYFLKYSKTLNGKK